MLRDRIFGEEPSTHVLVYHGSIQSINIHVSEGMDESYYFIRWLDFPLKQMAEDDGMENAIQTRDSRYGAEEISLDIHTPPSRMLLAENNNNLLFWEKKPLKVEIHLESHVEVKIIEKRKQ